MPNSDGPWRPVINLKSLNWLRQNISLQDGICQNGEGSDPEGGLDGQAQPKGRIFDNLSSLPEVSPVQVAEPGLAVQGTTRSAPQTFLPNNEACSGNIEEVGNLSSPLPGRHDCHG